MLPVSINEGVKVSFVDALFTSTSAVCVTGLIAIAEIIFVASFIRYSELQNQKRALSEQIKETEENIEETEYLLGIPLTDKDYIIRIAKEKLGLFLPDEIVYYSDLND